MKAGEEFQRKIRLQEGRRRVPMQNQITGRQERGFKAKPDRSFRLKADRRAWVSRQSSPQCSLHIGGSLAIITGFTIPVEYSLFVG